MKVIDLLNKIANGEEVPKKIKYKTYIYKFIKAENKYYEENNADQPNGTLGHYWALDGILNNEVEILDDEEDKDIPLIPDDELYSVFDSKEGINKNKRIDYNFKVLKEKINQVVTEFNEYRKEEK